MKVYMLAKERQIRANASEIVAVAMDKAPLGRERVVGLPMIVRDIYHNELHIVVPCSQADGTVKLRHRTVRVCEVKQDNYGSETKFVGEL